MGSYQCQLYDGPNQGQQEKGTNQGQHYKGPNSDNFTMRQIYKGPNRANFTRILIMAKSWGCGTGAASWLPVEGRPLEGREGLEGGE